MSVNELNEAMRTLCRNIGKDLVKFNVNVMAVEDIINNAAQILLAMDKKQNF